MYWSLMYEESWCEEIYSLFVLLISLLWMRFFILFLFLNPFSE